MKIVVLVVAYNAERTLEQVLDRIQPDMVARISSVIVCDDSSTDNTFNVALEYRQTHSQLPLQIERNPTNLGYGGNQKTGYRIAQEIGADIVVLLHGDGQYAPEILSDIIAPFEDKTVDAVFGSRMMTPGAARAGGMPLYKYYGNKILTRCENMLGDAQLSEWHSGYRAYRMSTLSQLPLNKNSDGFDFDTQIILQLLERKATIIEIPIPTYYGDEICYVDGVKYARQIMWHTLKFRLGMMGFGSTRSSHTVAYEHKADAMSSHGQLVTHIASRPTGVLVDLGCSDGSLTSEFKKQGHHVIGVDLSHHAGIDENVDAFIQCNLDDGLPSGLPDNIDIVVCADVLEHVRNPQGILEELSNKMNHGGVVIASIPNFGHWYPRARTALGFFDYDRRGILDDTHVRFFTRRSFERTARAAGYNVKRIGYTGLPFDIASRGGSGTLLSLVLKPFGIVDRVLVNLRPQLFAYQFLYELRP